MINPSLWLRINFLIGTYPLDIDVVDGRGGMFSVEGPTGNVLTRSRVFSDEEATFLSKHPARRAKDLDGIEG